MSTGPGNSFDVLLEIFAKNPDIAEIELATLDFAPLLEARGEIGLADAETISSAQKLRDEIHLPFWDGIMLAVSRSRPLPTGVLQAARFHQKLESKATWVNTHNLQLADLVRLSDRAFKDNRLLAVTSAVRMKNKTVMHIPMIDFHIPYSDHATSVVAEVVSLLESSGSILKSGKSYHFYGDTLLSSVELFGFLGRALLFAPIVDRPWVAHQLIEGKCALRISPRTEYGGVPIFLRHCGGISTSTARL